MVSRSRPRDPQSDSKQLANTATYDGKRFHLHQVVTSAPGGPTYHDGWIVIGLTDGLKLASPDFEQTVHYQPNEIPDSIEPQYAETGEPIFGY